MATLYDRPTGATTLSMRPRLASWNKTGDIHQLHLAEYLNHVESIAAPMITSAGPVPLAQRLGANRFTAVFARKTHQPTSSLVIAAAHARGPSGPADLSFDEIAGLVGPLPASAAIRQWSANSSERLAQI